MIIVKNVKLILFISIFTFTYGKSIFIKNSIEGFTDYNFSTSNQCSDNTIYCQKTAILPFQGKFGEDASDYTRLYLGIHTNLNIIERKDLIEIFNEQDLYPDRVSSATRAKIKELFGADLLVMGSVWNKKHFSLLNLLIPWRWLEVISDDWYIMIKMVDTETGQIYSDYYLKEGSGIIEFGFHDNYLSEAIEEIVKKMASDGQLLE